MRLAHGGDLEAAEKAFGIKKADWLDISTGINPRSWPVPAVPADIWRRLPALNNELIVSAREYYQCDSLLPIPGSQFAIQNLPALFSKRSVAIPVIGYQEHKHAWEKAGHDMVFYSDEMLDELDGKIESGQVDIVVVINPNNPSCKVIDKELLETWLKRLKEYDAYLIIDETFIDTMPEYSMAAHLGSGNLVLLRSLGKFFGLAGVRLGFLLAPDDIRTGLQQQLGPWAVNTPAQWIGIQALSDTDWQEKNRQWLKHESKRYAAYLKEVFADETINISYTPLYITLKFEQNFAASVYNYLGKHSILVRVIPIDSQTSYLRFGLLNNDAQWQRFKTVLETFIQKKK